MLLRLLSVLVPGLVVCSLCRGVDLRVDRSKIEQLLVFKSRHLSADRPIELGA